jgi:hypothetical protein
MAWAKQQSVTASADGVANHDSNTLTLPNPITSGNRLIAVLTSQAVGASAAYSVTDTAGNTWTEDNTHLWATSIVRVSIWSAPISLGGGTKPTITVSSSTNVYGISAVVTEFSGLSAVSGATALDGTAGNDVGSGTATSCPTGTTAVTTAANELAIAAYADYGWNATMTCAALTMDGNNSPYTEATVVMGHKDTGTSGTTQSATFTASAGVQYATAIAVYKLSSAASQVITPASSPNGGTAPGAVTLNVPQKITPSSSPTSGSAPGAVTLQQRLTVVAGLVPSGAFVGTPTITVGLAPFPSVTSLLAEVAGGLASAAVVFNALTNQAVALLGGNESTTTMYITAVNPDGSVYLNAQLPPNTQTKILYLFSSGSPLDVTSLTAAGIRWALTNQPAASAPTTTPTLAPPPTPAIQVIQIASPFPISGLVGAPFITNLLQALVPSTRPSGSVPPGAVTVKQISRIVPSRFPVGGIAPLRVTVVQPSSGGLIAPTFLQPFAPWNASVPLQGSLWYRPVANAIDATSQVSGGHAFYGRGDGTTASPGITAPTGTQQGNFGGKGVAVDFEYILPAVVSSGVQDLWSNPGWPSKNSGGFDTGKPMQLDPNLFVQASNGTDLGVEAINQAGAYLTPDGTTWYNFNAFSRDPTGGTPYASSVFADTAMSGRGTLGGRGASNLSAVGGSIRPGELVSATKPIPHAIKATAPLAYWARADAGFKGQGIRTAADGSHYAGYTVPAVTSDSNSGDTGNGNSYFGASFSGGAAGQFWIGSLLAIKPTDIAAALAAMTTQAGKNLAQCLCTYGMYIAENSATPWGDGPSAVGGAATWQVWMLEMDATATADYNAVHTGGFNTDFCNLLPYLFVVMNNDPPL